MLKGSEINCIRTFSGVNINVFDVNPELIKIEDIAHALAHQPRFGGHLPFNYSVAQHSCFCESMATPSKKLKALMHDASEAYLIDMPRPIKKLLPDYIKAEENLMSVIAKKFKFDWPMCKLMEEIDDYALKYDWDNYMLNHNRNTKDVIWSPAQAKEEFIKRFNLLTKI